MFCRSFCRMARVWYEAKDVTERLVRGSGPGGQAVNKSSNCVSLKHDPTGIGVKCHATRSVTQNRKIAYKLLNQKLDVWYNGDAAVVSLKKAKQLQKSRTRHRKARQRHLVKALAKLEAKTDPQLLSSDDAVGVAQSAGAARGSGNADGSAGAAAGAEVHDAAAEAKRKYFEVQQRRKAEREAAKEQRRLRQEAHRRQMQQARADVEVQ